MAVEGCLHSLSLKHGPVRKQKPINSGLIWSSKTCYVEMAFCYMFAVMQTELAVHTFQSAA